MRGLLFVAIVIFNVAIANSQCNYFAKIDSTNDPVLNTIIINSPDSNYFVGWKNDSIVTNKIASVAKINSIGDTIWTRQIGAGCASWISDLVNFDDSSFVICGGSVCKDSNGIAFGDFCYLYKMSINGDSLNMIKFNPATASVKSIIMTRDSNFIVMLNRSSPLTDNVYMFDKNFTFIKTFLNPMFETSDVKQGKNGDIIFCGGDWGPSDSWALLSADSTLTNINWLHYYGNGTGGWGEWFTTLIILPDSNILIAGNALTQHYTMKFSNGDIVDSLPLGGGIAKFILWNDTTIIEIANLGLAYYSLITMDTLKIVWGNLNNQTVNQVFDLLVNMYGCLTVVGAQYHNNTNKFDKSFFVTFGDTVKLNLGSEEYDEDIEINLSVYPNPSQEKTVVEFENATNELLNYTLCDIQSRVFLSGTTKENFIELHKNNNDAGVYFISVRNKDGSVVGRGKILWN